MRRGSKAPTVRKPSRRGSPRHSGVPAHPPAIASLALGERIAATSKNAPNPCRAEMDVDPIGSGVDALDQGGQDIDQATRLSDASAQRRLVVRAAEIGESWPELPAARQRALLPGSRSHWRTRLI